MNTPKISRKQANRKNKRVDHVPFVWGANAIAYNRGVTGEIDSMDPLFGSKWIGRIALRDDPEDSLGLAVLRLGIKKPFKMEEKGLQEAKKLLISQKPLVHAYWKNIADVQNMLASGEVAERDGFHQIGIIGALGGLTLPNVEAHERLYPIRINRQEIRCDNAGPGERRGGAGIEYEAEIDGEVVQSFRGEGLTYAAAYSTNGGSGGANAELSAVSDGHLVNDLPIFGKRTFKNPKIVVRSAGGGGWGDPLRRDPSAVVRDVLDGIVSPNSARNLYGVAVDEAGIVDAKATAKLRQNSTSTTSQILKLRAMAERVSAKPSSRAIRARPYPSHILSTFIRFRAYSVLHCPS